MNHLDPSATLGGWLSSPPLLAALHLIAMVLLVVVVAAWGRHSGRRVLTIAGVVSVVAIVVIYATMVAPSDVPIEWITILHESTGQMSIAHLYTRGAHAGPNFAFVISAGAAGRVPTLHDVVWLNLLLALVNLAIFAHIALHVAGRVWAWPWALVFAFNPATFQASFSELPSSLVNFYFLAGVLAWAAANDARPQPPGIRWAAYALTAMLTLLGVLTRLEAAVVGVVALVVHTLSAVVPRERSLAARQRLAATAEHIVGFLGEHLALVAGLCIVGWWLAFEGVPGGLVGRSQSLLVYPFNPYVFSLPFFLPMLGLPIGVTVSVVFGFVHGMSRLVRFGGLPVSLLMLIGLYFAGVTDYYGACRFLSYVVLPATFFLGLFGKATLEDLSRGWRPIWQRAMRIAYVTAWFSLPLVGSLEYFAQPEYRLDGGFAQLLLDRNTQREGRYLLELTEKNPDCVFVGRTLRIRSAPMEPPEYKYVLFGGPIADGPISVPEDEAGLDEVIQRHAAGATCVRLYYGGDCNLTFTDRCAQFVAGRRLIDERRFWSRPYNSPLQWGYAAPEMVLALYAWP